MKKVAPAYIVTHTSTRVAMPHRAKVLVDVFDNLQKVHTFYVDEEPI